MVELPTLYAWLLKIAIIAIVAVIAYLCVHVDKIFPGFKNTIAFKYIVTPVIYIAGFIAAMFFILF